MLFVWFLLFFIFEKCDAQNFAFTRNSHDGRLGNCLEDYAVGQYLAHKYNKPYIFRKFKYSDRFVFHRVAKLTLDDFKTYKGIVLKNEHHLQRILQENSGSDILFMVNGKMNLILDRNFLPSYHNDERKIARIGEEMHLMKLLKSHIQPIVPVSKVQSNTLPSIAIHIRTGGEFSIDKDALVNEKLANMFKANQMNYYFLRFVQFLGYEFYFRALKEIQKDLKGKPVYVHIFTDASNPEEIINLFYSKFKNDNFIFDYRKAGNSHDLNVVEDFFTMMQFDYLIRPFSTYSAMVQILGNYKKVIYPVSGYMKNNQFYLDKIDILESSKPSKIRQINFNDLGK